MHGNGRELFISGAIVDKHGVLAMRGENGHSTTLSIVSAMAGRKYLFGDLSADQD